MKTIPISKISIEDDAKLIVAAIPMKNAGTYASMVYYEDKETDPHERMKRLLCISGALNQAIQEIDHQISKTLEQLDAK